MSTSAIELHESRGASDSAGKVTASRRFAIWDDAAELTTPAQVRGTFGTTAGSTVIPQVGDLFPDETDIYCISYSIKRQPQSRGVWEVDFSYENTEVGSLQPAQSGYVQFSFDWAAEFRDVWRTSPGLVFPEEGDATDASFCFGTPIDVAGEPMSVLRYFTTLELTETVLMNTLDARINLIMLARGTRNSVVFRNGAVGSVLYKGAKASRIGIDKVQITHSFAQDNWYHLIQYPAVGSDGRVFLDGAVPTQRAANVFWKQPFPTQADFNQLSENF